MKTTLNGWHESLQMTEDEVAACNNSLLNRKRPSLEKRQKMAAEFDRVNAIYAQALAEFDADWESEA